MFREMHHANRSFRAMDLAEKIAERRRQSLAATSKPGGRARLTQVLVAIAAATGSTQAEGRA